MKTTTADSQRALCFGVPTVRVFGRDYRMRVGVLEVHIVACGWITSAFNGPFHGRGLGHPSDAEWIAALRAAFAERGAAS